MAGSLNKIYIMGNLGKDPELKQTQSQKSYTNMSVATTETYKDKDGNKQDSTQWHTVSVWGKQAEHCTKYLAKGSSVLVEGTVRYESYEKDGDKKYFTKILAQKVVFLGSKRDKGQSEPPLPDDIPF